MERPTSKLCLATAVIAICAGPALAQNYDDLSRSDFISLSAGDASRANIAIQTPTPWPAYLNNIRIPGDGTRSVLVIQQLNKRYEAPSAPPSTVINIGGPSQ